MNKTEIIEFLMKELASVYCGSCAVEDNEDNDDWCDECHRKSMNWGLSMAKAEEFATKIIGESK